MLVKRPVGHVPPARRHCDVPEHQDHLLLLERMTGQVPDHGDSHVRVCLQTEGQDGDTDEEDRDHANYLDIRA